MQHMDMDRMKVSHIRAAPTRPAHEHAHARALCTPTFALCARLSLLPQSGLPYKGSMYD